MPEDDFIYKMLEKHGSSTLAKALGGWPAAWESIERFQREREGHGVNAGRRINPAAIDFMRERMGHTLTEADVAEFKKRLYVRDEPSAPAPGVPATAGAASVPDGASRDRPTPAELHAKLKRHLRKTAECQTGGITTVIAFCASIKIHPADYYRWRGKKKLRAPGHAIKIESAIKFLPK